MNTFASNKRKVLVRVSKQTRQLATTCISCGLMITRKASGHEARICLICYARLLNDYFQRNLSLKSPDNGQSKQ